MSKAGGWKDKYLDATQKAQHANAAKRNAEKGKFASVNDNKENNFHVAKQDVIGQKFIGGDDGNPSLDDASKKLVRKQDYERLLNIKFLWSQNLPHVDPVASPAQFMMTY